ncbi:unnamed protein product, partial [Protopolystoma xenopodis]
MSVLVYFCQCVSFFLPFSSASLPLDAVGRRQAWLLSRPNLLPRSLALQPVTLFRQLANPARLWQAFDVGRGSSCSVSPFHTSTRQQPTCPPRRKQVTISPSLLPVVLTHTHTHT